MAQQERSFDGGPAAGRLRYLQYLPEGYGAEPEQRWPLILFLHGAGERGDDLALVRRHGIPRVVDERPGFPFIAVSPQCPLGTSWHTYNRTFLDLLDHLGESLAVDADRVYLTGISMGGYGTWHLASDDPGRFAAIAPICGGGVPALGFPGRVCLLGRLPVWAFHGALDDMVPLEESRRLVNTLAACGGDVRFTVYPDLAHDSWTRTYHNPELYQWFLSHRRLAHHELAD